MLQQCGTCAIRENRALQETVRELRAQIHRNNIYREHCRHCAGLQEMLKKAEETKGHLQEALQKANQAGPPDLLAEKRKRKLAESKCALLTSENEQLQNIHRKFQS